MKIATGIEKKENLREKYETLKGILHKMECVLVAYSGGTDSTLLLATAAEIMGERALAVTVRTPLHTKEEIDNAVRAVSLMSARHMIVDLDPLTDGRFADNPTNRCYICKGMMLDRLAEIASSEGIAFIVEGSNVNDRNDFRPGARAVKEHGVRSPLDEAGLSKPEIRELSRALGLRGWNDPARPCLATRFPYGTRITRELIEQIARAEKVLLDASYESCRIRHHGDMARIELSERNMMHLAASPDRIRITREIKNCGYAYVALDLEGYRMGRMNETLQEE